MYQEEQCDILKNPCRSTFVRNTEGLVVSLGQIVVFVGNNGNV